MKKWFLVTGGIGVLFLIAAAYMLIVFGNNAITCTGTAFNWPALFIFASAATFIISIIGGALDVEDDKKQSIERQNKDD